VQPYDLYPAIEPYHTGFLPVSDRHTLYYEESGNPAGRPPVVFLHGGPGGGTHPFQRQFFDPQFYHIILFDQRGCGKSTPFADLNENTTWHLVADIERLREHLAIDRWLVFGGSWGSTLALAYAVTHPDRVVGLILRGIFLCRSSELRWFYQEGASNLYPDAWEKYLAPIPEEERGDLIGAYYKRLTSDDEETQLEAARAWSIWEASTSRLLPDAKAAQEFEDPRLALPFARIECHYFYHGGFFESDAFLLDAVHKIAHIPTRIVQGRYDLVCPIRTAWQLSKALPEAELVIIPDAGHAASEPRTQSELVHAADDFKRLFS